MRRDKKRNTGRPCVACGNASYTTCGTCHKAICRIHAGGFNHQCSTKLAKRR